VRGIVTELEFDGEKISATLSPLLYEDLLVMRSTGTEDRMLVEYAKLLPKYLVKMDPVLDAAGTPIPFEEMCKVTYFAPIIAQLMRSHVVAASPANPTLPVVQSED